MNEKKALPLNTANFREIRNSNFLYIDKTEYLFQLFTKGISKYFFRRPRRFGKSLTISTLEALLQGKKELFEGLWIYNNWSWESYSVVRLDFSNVDDFNDKASLAKRLNSLIIMAGVSNNVALSSTDWNDNFEILMLSLKKRGKVAILIDEYDSPFHKVINNDLLHSFTRNCLSSFYKKMKAYEDFYDFLFITGITKIAKTSVFSGLNMLTDISLESQYGSLCGITQDELEIFYSEHINYMASKKHTTRESVLAVLKQMYKGYLFSPDSNTRVYNTFSLHNVFNFNKFRNYWFNSGSPSLLIRLIEKTNYDLTFLNTPTLALKEIESSYDFADLSLINLLFQTGYLTIDSVLESEDSDDLFESAKLRFPNKEVRISFMDELLKSIRRKETTQEERTKGKSLIKALRKGYWSEFAVIWNEILSHVPSKLHIPEERYYHSQFMIFTQLFEIDSQAERLTSIGQMDMVIKFDDQIFIIEFKLDKSAKSAIQQINEKKYYSVFLSEGKKISLVGLSFSSKKRQIEEIIVEDLQDGVVKKVYKAL